MKKHLGKAEIKYSSCFFHLFACATNATMTMTPHAVGESAGCHWSIALSMNHGTLPLEWESGDCFQRKSTTNSPTGGSLIALLSRCSTRIVVKVATATQCLEESIPWTPSPLSHSRDSEQCFTTGGVNGTDETNNHDGMVSLSCCRDHS